MRVAVLMGGLSAEREVSLASGVQVTRALREAGHRVTAVDTAGGPLGEAEEEEILDRGVGAAPPEPDGARAGDGRELLEVPFMAPVADADVVFPVLHGGAGEDGRLQAVLELAGRPYAGSPPLGCGLAMDKDVSKRLFRDEEIPTAGWRLDPAGPAEVEALGYPLIVKPAAGGSTLGLAVVREETDLAEALAGARRFDDAVMAEAFVSGREITVGVVDDEALPVGEIIPEHEIFDYACKYQPELAREVFPADLPEAAAGRARELALRVHRTLRLSGFSRVDFILDDEGEAWCLEANALPGMTSNSLLPKAAAAAGVSFPELCDRIVRAAARGGRQGDRPAGADAGARP